MNAGSRVETPEGPGTLIRLVIDHRWAFNRPDVITWAAVQLDGKQYAQMFHPAHIREEQPVFACSTDDIDESAGQSGVLIQAPEEPTPDPTEPEPEGEEADEKLEELIEFPE